MASLAQEQCRANPRFDRDRLKQLRLDSSRWMGLIQCRSVAVASWLALSRRFAHPESLARAADCQALFVEDSFSPGGQMEVFFVYRPNSLPASMDEALDWFQALKPLASTLR